MPHKAMLSIVFTTTLLLVADEKQTPAPHAFPPQRRAFTFDAPPPMLLGKLWMDVGLFHPFHEVTRAAWEREYFGLLNEAIHQKRSLQFLAADAIGALKDAGSMVLGKEEGTGTHFLPVLFEVRPDRSVWIIGGDRRCVSKVFGPIERINEENVLELLARHVGSNPSLEQVAATLSAVTLRNASFSWTIRSRAGESLSIRSVNELPADLWVKDGWDGTALHTLPSMSPEELTKITRVDARIAPWLCSGLLAEGLGKVWPVLKKQALSRNVYRISRRNVGYASGEVSDDYQSRSILEAAAFVPSIDADRTISCRWPQGGTAPIDLARALAGWALDPAAKATAATARYGLGEVDVVLRTAFYGEGATHASSAPPWPTHGAFPALGLDHGKTLEGEAARALAAASVVNFDHLFGFTPEPLQETLAKGAVDLYKKVSSVPEFLFRMGSIIRDPHAHDSQANLGARIDEAEKLRHPSTPPVRFLPFRGLSPDKKTLIVIFVNSDSPTVIPVRPGAKIHSIEGRPIEEWLSRAELNNSGRPDDWMRPSYELNYCLPQQDTLRIEYTNPGEPMRSASISTVKARSYVGSPFPIPKTPLPKGWALIHEPGKFSYDEVITRLEQGENLILDFRAWPQLLKEPWERLVNHGLYSFVRAPEAPVQWGTVPEVTPLVTESGSYALAVNAPKHTKGKAVLVVWGGNQSSMETMPLLLRTALGLRESTYLVGLPTAGVTGPISTVRLPLGETEGYAYHTPTGSWPVFDGSSIQYKGLPIDHPILLDDILRVCNSGLFEDPLMEVIIQRLPTLH